MTGGHIFLFLGLVSFGALGVLHKVADVSHAEPKGLTAALYCSSMLLMLTTLVLFRHQSPVGQPAVLLTALPFGISAGIAILAFQTGIRFGSITTSWLVINLSSAIPTVLSLILYKEQLTPLKIVALSLIPIAIVLLWKDRAATGRERGQS